MSELQEVDAWLAALLANLEPAARTKMLREVARDLRRIQQKNITAQPGRHRMGAAPDDGPHKTGPHQAQNVHEVENGKISESERERERE